MASPNFIEFRESNCNSSVTSGTLVVADCWAPWCGPCRQIAPVIDQIADKFAGKVKVGKVNVDENPDLAVKYDVQTIPRILLFKGSDKQTLEHVGTISASDLERLINANM